MKNSWGNGSNVPGNAMKSSSRPSSDSSKAARASRLTALASIARRPAPRVSESSALTQLISVSTRPSNTLIKYYCDFLPANQGFRITCSLLFQSEFLTTFFLQTTCIMPIPRRLSRRQCEPWWNCKRKHLDSRQIEKYSTAHLLTGIYQRGQDQVHWTFRGFLYYTSSSIQDRPCRCGPGRLLAFCA